MHSTPNGSTYVGHVVFDEQQHEIGTVVDVIYDDAATAGSHDEQPSWLVVDPGLFRAAHWVPVAGTYRTAMGHVVIPWDRELVKHAPRARGDHRMDEELRSLLQQHYELTS